MAGNDKDLKHQIFMQRVRRFDDISQMSYQRIITQPLNQHEIDMIHAGNKVGVSTLNLDVSKIKIVIAGIMIVLGMLLFSELAFGSFGITSKTLMNIALFFCASSVLMFYFANRLISAILLKFFQERYVFFLETFKQNAR